MTQAPDFIEPVAGYRAWRLGPDARLYPVGWNGPAWQPSVNRAQCYRSGQSLVAPPAPHSAPDPKCRCGIHAFRSIRTHQLRFYGAEPAGIPIVVGAIAAWGDLEVYAQGFRAEYACVLALALPPHRLPTSEGLLFTQAAEHYGVPLVAWRDQVVREARQHAAPLPADLVPQPRRASTNKGPSQRRGATSAARRRTQRPTASPDEITGYWVDQHVWVRGTRESCVIGITAPFAALPTEPVVDPALVGDRMDVGEAIARFTVQDDELIATTPVRGTVLQINPGLATAPTILRREPLTTGWLVRMRPSHWSEDIQQLGLGRPGLLEYHATLVETRNGGDHFASLRASRPDNCPDVVSWDDVRRALEAARRRPRYATAEALHAEVTARLERRLASDSGLSGRLSRLCTTVAYEFSRPRARQVFELDGEKAALRLDDWEAAADLSFQMPGDLAAPTGLARWTLRPPFVAMTSR